LNHKFPVDPVFAVTPIFKNPVIDVDFKLAIIFYLFYGVHVSIDKLYDSVQETLPELILPPNANPAVFVPAPPKEYLPVIKLQPADHDVPLYDSVIPRGLPELPIANAAVLDDPAPASLYLTVDKAPPDDHEVPLYDSVQLTHVGPARPPNANADVFVPAPPKLYLPIIKGLTDVQDVPLYASVQLIDPAGLRYPPITNAAVFVPTPAGLTLPLIKAPPADQELPL